MGDLTEALRKLRKYFAPDFDEKMFDIYVPPKGNKQGEVISIQETLIEDMEKAKELVFVVLGDSGLGKTTLGLWLSKIQWMLLEKAPEARIPLFIHLPKIKTERLKKELLYDYLKSLVGLNGEERQTILTKPLLLILDGFDELKVEDRKNLFESNGWGDKRLDIKVVITCRPEALLGKNAQVYFEVKSHVLQGGVGYLSYQLEPFTEKEIHDYIDRFTEQKKKSNIELELDWLNPNTYHDWLERLTNLKSLIQNPFLLTLVIAVLPRLVKKYEKKKRKKNLKSFKQIHYTRNHIFKEFTEEWFGKQASRLQENGYLTNLPIQYLTGYLLAYAQNLAASLLQEGKLDLILSDKETLGEHLAEPTHDVNLLKDYEERKNQNGYFSKEHLENSLKVLRSGCLLKTQAETFQFLHKSLIEYFAAKDLFEGLQGEWDFYFKEALKDEPEKKRGMNREYLNDEPEILEMLADRAKEDEDFGELLCDLVMSSKLMPGIEIVSANALSILNLARVNFKNLDFREVQIPKTDLTGGLCEGTDFRGANLDSAILRQTHLANSLWQNASTHGVHFGEQASLQLKKSKTDWLFDKAHRNEVCCVAFYQDEKKQVWVLAGSKNGCVYRYSFETLQAHPHRYYNHSYSYMEDITNALFGSGSGSKTGGSVYSIAVYSENHYLAVGGSGTYDISLWNLSTGKKIHKLKGHTHLVTSVAFSHNGCWLASGSFDCTVQLWEIQNKPKLISVLTGHGVVRAVAFSSDNRWFASGGDKGMILWQMPTAQKYLAFEGSGYSVYSLTFSPDNQWLAFGGGKKVRLWRLSDGEAGSILQEHTDGIRSLAFSPDSQWLASACHNGKLYLWQMPKCNVKLVLKENSCGWVEPNIGFSPTGDSLAMTIDSENKIYFWQPFKKNITPKLERQLLHSKLTLQNANFTHAYGLSESQQNFLIQRQATVVVPPETQVYRPLYSLFKPLPGTASHKTHYALVRMVGTMFSCYEDLWVVSVAHKKSGINKKNSFSFSKTQDDSLHGFLIIEGVQNHRRFIIRADLRSPGQGKVAIDIKALDDFEKFQESVQHYEANQWQITRNEGMKLIQNIREDQGKVLSYSQWGGKSIFTIFSSKQTMSTEVHNCLTWCREQLKKINIFIPEGGREWLFVLPEDVIKKPNVMNL